MTGLSVFTGNRFPADAESKEFFSDESYTPIQGKLLLVDQLLSESKQASLMRKHLKEPASERTGS